jgi:hypothetical protein
MARVSGTLRILAAAAAGVVIAFPFPGCGGSSDDSSTRRAAPGAETKPPRLPSADRRAYAQIQRASGALRAAAVPITYGASAAVDLGPVRRATRRVSATHPRNAQLQRLRASMLRALGAINSASPGAASKTAATEAIAEADHTDAALRRYAASHPAANEIAPR